MKKTFKLLAFALMASLVAFTACQPEDETENQGNGSEIVDDNNDPDNPGDDPENPGDDPENPGDDPENPGDEEQTGTITCDFDGVASWNPQSVYGGYEMFEDELFMEIIATREQTSFEEVYAFFNEEGIDGENLPEDWLIMGFMGEEGTRNIEGCMLNEGTSDGILLLTGDTTIAAMDITVPTGWVSTELTITITELDLVNKKVSANITATMADVFYILTEGILGNPEEKTFTIAINNLSVFDWYENDLEKLVKKLKK